MQKARLWLLGSLGNVVSGDGLTFLLDTALPLDNEQMSMFGYISVELRQPLRWAQTLGYSYQPWSCYVALVTVY